MAKRVMIVDDSMRWRMELKNVLATHGFSIVAEASGGRQAIDMYENVNPDVVMIDASMPDMDGVCTTRELMLRYPDALVVLCAGSGEKASVSQAMSMGAVDFCAKPYTPRAVVNVLRRVLAGVAN